MTEGGRQREKSKKRSARKRYYPASKSPESFASRVISPGTILKLSSNYRCYWPCFRAPSSVRCAENLAEVRRPANVCIRQRNLHFNSSVCLRYRCAEATVLRFTDLLYRAKMLTIFSISIFYILIIFYILH